MIKNGVVYKIPCECGEVYIGETGRSMHEQIKEYISQPRHAAFMTSNVLRPRPFQNILMQPDTIHFGAK